MTYLRSNMMVFIHCSEGLDETYFGNYRSILIMDGVAQDAVMKRLPFVCNQHYPT